MAIWSKLFGSHKNDSNRVTTQDNYYDIPEETFIEKTEQKPEVEETPKEIIRQDNIQMLYDFLSKDYQQSGYEDALVNPDTSYRDENILAILSDLDIIIKRVKTFYEDTLKELDFLIESRNRLGMVCKLPQSSAVSFRVNKKMYC